MDGPNEFTAYDMLLDRPIIDSADEPIGVVDELELTVPDDGGQPILTALLTGPTALGPRIGGTLGQLWTAVGRRLRPKDQPYPNRVPLDLVERLDRTAVKVTVRQDDLPVDRFHDWTWYHVIGKLPGSGR